MNSNIAAYIIYLCITLYIIVLVGRLFHQSGRVFIIRFMKDDVHQADNINNILLVAYYLFNIGYCFITLRFWEYISSLPQLISSLSTHLGILILTLAVTHYFNILLIYFLSKKHNSITH